MRKTIWRRALPIFTLLSAPQIFACNVTTLPYEWPLFGNHETSSELKAEAIEFLEYLLDGVKNGREYALDAWSHFEIKEGIKNALGVREYREALKKASIDGNDFALNPLAKFDRNFNNDKTYAKLAYAQNPEFLLDVVLNEAELANFFWPRYGQSYGHLQGTTPKEKLLEAAIDRGWNAARIAKADMLFEQFSQDNNEVLAQEAFHQLRYAAKRGFSKAMYKLHVKLQELPHYLMADDERLGKTKSLF